MSESGTLKTVRQVQDAAAAKDGWPTPSEVAASLAVISRWVDASPANAARDPEAALWGRVAKVSEEAGEAIAALIGYTGQNPRKGVTNDRSKVMAELLDVAVTALAAVEHIQGNLGLSMDMFDHHVRMLMDRAGLS